MKINIRPIAFFVPLVFFIPAIILNFADREMFVAVITGTSTWLMTDLAWAFDLGVLTMLFVAVYMMFSKFGDVRIGGSKAAPFLTDFQYFSITLTSIIAVGILLWGTAEPMYHYTAPPASLGIEPRSPEAAVFAISTLFLHWGFTPLAIYAVPSVMFAFAYYNMKKPYSLGSALVPLFGDRTIGPLGQSIDAVCMYALIAGMAASLGSGILSISGGISYLTGVQSGAFLWLMVDIAIVATFIISSVTGLFSGIRKLSRVNTFIFFSLVSFIFICGPTVFILNIGTESLGSYLQNFFSRSLFTGAAAGDPWGGQWTIFYWCNWLAWAPVAGMFLGRISYGQTVRKAFFFILVLPALFQMLWMLIFGAATLHLQMEGHDIVSALARGAEHTVYAVFSQYPLAWLTIPVFVVTMCLSFVTGADAYTTTLGGMSLHGLNPENPEPPKYMKFFWGCLIGAVAWIMIAFAGGITGIKMLSNIGGGPALVLEILMIVCLIKVSMNPMRYDSFREDYTADGTPIRSVKLPVSVPGRK